MGNKPRLSSFTIVMLFLVSFSIACSKKQTVRQPADFPTTTARTPSVITPEPRVYEPPRTTVVGDNFASTYELSLDMIHYEFNIATLTEEARLILARNARELKRNQMVNIVIAGHCDERGTSEYNLALGERRALSARDYLQTFGISESRISIISYGEEQPLINLSNDYAWAKNRRAEFKSTP